MKAPLTTLAAALALTLVGAVAAPATTEAGDGFRFRVGFGGHHRSSRRVVQRVGHGHRGQVRVFRFRHCDRCVPTVETVYQRVPAVYETRRVHVGYRHGEPVFRLRRVLVRRAHRAPVLVTHFRCRG